MLNGRVNIVLETQPDHEDITLQVVVMVRRRAVESSALTANQIAYPPRGFNNAV